MISFVSGKQKIEKMAEYTLLEKYESIRHRFEEVEQLITDPEIIADMKRYVKLNQEYKNLQKLVEVFKEYKNLINNIESGKEILADRSGRQQKCHSGDQGWYGRR